MLKMNTPFDIKKVQTEKMAQLDQIETTQTLAKHTRFRKKKNRKINKPLKNIGDFMCKSKGRNDLPLCSLLLKSTTTIITTSNPSKSQS